MRPLSGACHAASDVSPAATKPDNVEHVDRVADGQPCLAEGLDDLQRRARGEARDDLRHLPGGAGCVRSPQPPACCRGMGRGCLCRRDRPGARRQAGPRRGHPRRHDAREAQRSQGALRGGRHRDGGELLIDQRRASAVLLGAEGALDIEPLARITGRGVFGNDPDVFGVAPSKPPTVPWPELAAPGRTSTSSS